MKIIELLRQKPGLFRKHRYGDTTVYVYMKRDRLFGWAVMETKNGEKHIVPAIGKLQYPICFRATSEYFDVFLEPSRYLEPHLGEKAPLLLKLDGFWLMAYSIGDRVYYRTRTKPRVGKNSIIDKIINSPHFPRAAVEKMVRDGYWPQFEIWGPALRQYNVLFGGTRVDELVKILGLNGKLFPNILMIMDAAEKKYITDYAEVKKISETYGLTPAPHLKEIGYTKKKIRLTPEEIIDAMTFMQEFNEAHGAAHTSYETIEKDGVPGIRVKIPPSTTTDAVIEGAVAHVYNGPYFEGYKIKPLAVMMVDTVVKQYPPFERVKAEVFKVIGDQTPEEILLWMRDCKYAGNGPCLGKLVNEVLDYLAEDYAVTVYEGGVKKKVIPKKIVKGVWKDVRKYLAQLILKNYPEIAGIHPRDMNKKYGLDAKLIGLIVTRTSR